MSGDVSPNVYKTKAEELRARRDRLTQDARHSFDPATLAAQTARILQIASSLKDLYESLPEPKQADLLREVFSTIVLSSDGIVGFALRSPFDQLSTSATNDPRRLNANGRARLADAILDTAA